MTVMRGEVNGERDQTIRSTDSSFPTIFPQLELIFSSSASPNPSLTPNFFYLSSPSSSSSINLFLLPPSLHPSLQLSQCNVNDVPSIASDSARTLTSPPPLHRLVISLFFTPLLHSLFRCSFLHLSSFISPSLSLSSHACHLSSVPLPSFSSLFRRPSFISLYSSIVLWEHLLSLSASAIFYLGFSSFSSCLSLCCLCSPSLTC